MRRDGFPERGQEKRKWRANDRAMNFWCAAMLLLTMAGAAQAASSVVFYVAPQGSDRWTGRLSAPNAAKTDGPFASLARAQQAARTGGHRQAVKVLVRGGIYFLPAPLVFTPADSGTAAAGVTFAAFPGERPVLSGGRPVTGWTKTMIDGKPGWTAPVPEDADFRMLRVGDTWATRARTPNFDPKHPYTGGWLFAQFPGRSWERGAFGEGVFNLQNVGSRLTWNVPIPVAGTYAVWVRHADDNGFDMSGRTTLQVGDAAPVTLENLPKTGGWSDYRWAKSATLTLTQGEVALHWANAQGGGFNLDALALADDPNWTPGDALPPPAPAAGRHLVLIQAEAADTVEGKGIGVPRASPPGSTKTLQFAPGALPPIANPSGAEVHVFPDLEYYNAILPVESINADARQIAFAGSDQGVRAGNRFFVENVREALDAPGEWFLDRANHQLLLLPDNPRFPNLPAIAGHLDRLITLQGDLPSGRFVEYLRFEGFDFRDAEYALTTSYYTPDSAAIALSAARHCAVENCRFSTLGGYALRLTDGSRDIRFVKNNVQDMGEGGVMLEGNDATQPKNNLIAGNVMRRLGKIYKHVAGVYVVTGSGNRIAHNTISDVPRYGISLKSPGAGDRSHGNIVEFNDIRRTNLETHDSGAIELLGRDKQPNGNVIRFNLILDSVGLGTRSDGTLESPSFTWGIYLDDYSSGTTVSSNIVARNVLGGFDIHGGRNNLIENNIFVGSRDSAAFYQPIDPAFMTGNVFRRNIIVPARPETLLIQVPGDARRDAFSVWDNNLYWLRGGAKLADRKTPLGTWAAWRAAGFDAHSLVGDPLFVNAARDDYRLRPASPAFKLGFKAIPVERIGAAGWKEKP